MSSTLVVVPTLGERLELLDDCLTSLATQTPQPQVVIVTSAVARERLEQLAGERADVVVQTRPGLSAAINEGWALAGPGTTYLAWLGDDDLLEPGSLARALACLERAPRASMVFGACRMIDITGRELFVSRPGRMDARWLLSYGSNRISQPGTLFRREAVDAVGSLDEQLRLTMDLDLFLRLRGWGPLVRTSHVLASYRVHDDTLSLTNFAQSRQEARMVQRRSRPARPLDPLNERVATFASRVWHKLDTSRPRGRLERA